MFQELRQKAGMEPETPTATKANAETEETSETPGEGETPPGTQETTPATQPTEKKGKVSPWKLMEEHKAARLRAEQELAELRKAVPDPNKIKDIETKAEAAERRAQELEQEIRFTNYAKSQEFQEKYQKPYEQAWVRWMADLGELTVEGTDGAERPIQPNDLLEIVNAPLQKARDMAEKQFGSFADDVMSARKEIKGLFESQQRALEEARKAGTERQQQIVKQMQEQQQSMAKEISTHWTEANKQAVTDEKYGKYFQPVEGDEEGNKRLARGFELADKAFSINPLDPRLNPEQRASIVKLHAAVRNRAAAFGRLSFQNQQLEAQVKSLTEELNKFKEAEPTGGERQGEHVEGHTSAKDSVFGALRKLAH